MLKKKPATPASVLHFYSDPKYHDPKYHTPNIMTPNILTPNKQAGHEPGITAVYHPHYPFRQNTA